MQTFLPYPDFYESLKCLDNRRLGKQRVEAMQLVNALEGNSKGWRNHPACLMWKGHIEALKTYHDIAIELWIARGFKNTMKLYGTNNYDYPEWFNDKDFHASHRSNLLRKDFAHYSKFNWTEPINLEYIWPVTILKNVI